MCRAIVTTVWQARRREYDYNCEDKDRSWPRALARCERHVKKKRIKWERKINRRVTRNSCRSRPRHVTLLVEIPKSGLKSEWVFRRVKYWIIVASLPYLPKSPWSFAWTTKSQSISPRLLKRDRAWSRRLTDSLVRSNKMREMKYSRELRNRYCSAVKTCVQVQKKYLKHRAVFYFLFFYSSPAKCKA